MELWLGLYMGAPQQRTSPGGQGGGGARQGAVHGTDLIAEVRLQRGPVFRVLQQVRGEEKVFGGSAGAIGRRNEANGPQLGPICVIHVAGNGAEVGHYI